MIANTVDSLHPTHHTHDVDGIAWEHMTTTDPATTMLGAAGHILTITTDDSPADGPQGWLWSVDSPQHGLVVDRRPAPDMTDALRMASQVVSADYRPIPGGALGQTFEALDVTVRWIGGARLDTAVVGWLVSWGPRPIGHGYQFDVHEMVATYRDQTWVHYVEWLHSGCVYHLVGPDGVDVILPNVASQDHVLVYATQVVTTAPRESSTPASAPVLPDVDQEPAADDAPQETSLPAHVLGELDTVTDEIVEMVLELVDGFTADGERVDWVDIWERLDRYTLADGRGIDSGDSLISPALEAIKRRVRAARKAS
jgi:hypothetical protein